MQNSSIEWTHFTSNPVRYRDPDGNIVHACIHKSAGCIHCYAEVMARRWGRKGMPFTAGNMNRLTPFLDESELRHMLSYKPARGKSCFVGDMTDVFGEWVPFDLLDRLFAVFAQRRDVTWQVLTKRAARMREYLTSRAGHLSLPLPNVWLGVSAEDQDNADERIPLLLETPAAVRFVSYEPGLGPVNFADFISLQHGNRPRLDWIIMGGESGPGARPFQLQWARDVIVQCRAAGVAVFFKQAGSTLRLKDRKGGDPEEWPEDLRVREFPR